MKQRLISLSFQAGLYILGDILQKGLAFILIPLYTIYLTPSDYGILSITTAFMGALSIFYLQSLEGAFTRIYFEFDSEEQRRRYYGSVWFFLLLYTILISLVIDSFGNMSNTLGFQNISYRPYLRLSLWTVFFANVSLLLPRALFRVEEKVWKFCGLNLSLALMTSCLIIYFVAFENEGALGSLKGSLLGSIFIAVPGFIIIFKNIRFYFSILHIKKSLAFAVPLIPHLLSLWALNLSDRFILERYVSLRDIGIYGLGYQLASILQIIAFSATNAISPFYYRTATNSSDAHVLLPRVATYYLIFLAWAGIGIIGFSHDIISLIASEKSYLEATKVIPWVVLGFFARGFYFVFVMAVYYSKNLKLLAIITIFSCGINIVFNLITVPKFGYIAAAINTFIAFAIQAVIMYFYAQQCYPLKYELKRFAHLVIGFLGISIILCYITIFQTYMGFVIKAALVLFFPLILMITNFFDHTELRLLVQYKQEFKLSLGEYYVRAKNFFKIH
jgi:O-antigen/teichoic acid export membrane protein